MNNYLYSFLSARQAIFEEGERTGRDVMPQLSKNSLEAAAHGQPTSQASAVSK